MRHINEAGLELIKHFERFSPLIYLCPASFETIGYGHLVSKSERSKFKKGITEEEALALLEQDLRVAETAVSLFIKAPLTDNQFSAVTSFTFNVGSGALQRSTLRAVINRSEHELVPEQLARWIWAGGRKLPGLVLRRAAEASLYMTD